jgi:hypothetical protein
VALADRRLDGVGGLDQGGEDHRLGLAEDGEQGEGQDGHQDGVLHGGGAAGVDQEAGQIRSRSQATSGASAGGIG